jgi:hypothetical protein
MRDVKLRLAIRMRVRGMLPRASADAARETRPGRSVNRSLDDHWTIIGRMAGRIAGNMTDRMTGRMTRWMIGRVIGRMIGRMIGCNEEAERCRI